MEREKIALPPVSINSLHKNLFCREKKYAPSAKFTLHFYAGLWARASIHQLASSISILHITCDAIMVFMFGRSRCLATTVFCTLWLIGVLFSQFQLCIVWMRNRLCLTRRGIREAIHLSSDWIGTEPIRIFMSSFKLTSIFRCLHIDIAQLECDSFKLGHYTCKYLLIWSWLIVRIIFRCDIRAHDQRWS